MSGESPAVILYNNVGNPVGVVLEGIVYKLQAQVTGQAADGYPVSGNPVLMAGSDGYSVHTLRTDAKGDGYMVITSPKAAESQYATITPYNTLRVSQEPSTLLIDKFDGDSLDEVRWETSANLVFPGIVLSGNLQINIGTTALGYSSIASKFSFFQMGNAFLQIGTNIKFEYPLLTNTHRFWGFGSPGNNTTLNPLTNAVGFEVDILGNLNAVIYSDGYKIFSQTLTTPTSGDYNRFIINWRTDSAYFFLNTIEAPVATAQFKTPAIQTLPVRYHIINHSVAPSSGAFIQVSAIGLTDTGRNNLSISDGEYQWQKLSIDASGAIPLQESAEDGNNAPNRTIQIGAKDINSKLRTIRAITDGSQMLEVQDTTTNDLLIQALRELKKISFLLTQMSDINISLSDLE